MSKSKRAARSPSKIRSKAAGSKKSASHLPKRVPSKQMRVLGLLHRPSGVTIANIMRCTGWQPHSVRGFFAGVVRRKLGLKLESQKTDGERVYRIVTGKPAKAKSRAKADPDRQAA